MTNSIIVFGHAIANISNEYLQSLDYFYRPHRTLPIDHIDRGIIYYNLGRTYRLLDKYEQALTCFRCGKLLLRRLLWQTMFNYCRVLYNIGVVYIKLGDFQRAITQLEHALMLQQKSFPDNHTEIPFHRNRLGYVYFKVQRFEDALTELSKADEFFQHRMPIDHQGHEQTLHALALVYRALSI